MCLPHYVRDHHSQMVTTFPTFEQDFSIASTITVRAASACVHRGRVLLARVRNEKLLKRFLPSAGNEHFANQRHVLGQELARSKAVIFCERNQHYCDKLLLKVVKKISVLKVLT